MQTWWRDAVLYHIYVRSFADANGDGIGDLQGIRGRLDYLEWLGVDALWLSPTFPSPNTDWGYDVSDYYDVHPDYGTLDDMDALVAEAATRGIRILLDLVPNHTSDRHHWFQDARSSRDAAWRDFYTWADPGPDGGPPNNWRSAFGGPAWSFDETTGQYYLHSFLSTQPDLNWRNPGVRSEFENIQRFWFDRGIAGFRIDVVYRLFKDPALRDNPPAGAGDRQGVYASSQRHVHNADLPEVHEVLKDWRRIADSYDPPRLLLGETILADLDRLATYYGDDDELQLALNIAFASADLDAAALADVVDRTEARFPSYAWPLWFASNHDGPRHFATRWCDESGDLIRCALMLLLTLRGTPLLYYGDEIGMPDTALTLEQLRDPVGLRAWPKHAGRDPGRTPMHWSREPGAGFAPPGVAPWLPYGRYEACNVADQRKDLASTLNFTRDLIAYRSTQTDLRSGEYRRLPAPEDVWLYRRGDHLIVVNLGASQHRIDDVHGRLVIATNRDIEGQSVTGRLDIDGATGLIVLLSPQW